MDLNMLQDLLYTVPRIIKIKFVYSEDEMRVCWRFCRGQMYLYRTTATSASVDQILTQEALEESFHTHLLLQPGFLKVKYTDTNLPPDEYTFS